MTILFDHSLPFAIAHGGLQIQIEQTINALKNEGVEVEFLRWWDSSQKGEIIHFFGRPAPGVIEMAQAKGIRCVLSDLLTSQGSRSALMHQTHRVGMRIAETVLPRAFVGRLPSQPFSQADRVVALTQWEAHLMQSIYGAPRDRVRVIPNGVEDFFFDEVPVERSRWLVCVAAITPRKRVLELAEAAVAAEVPLRVIGKPYSEGETYFRRFLQCVADGKGLVRYDGEITDRRQLAALYREARGFVLLSTMESLSLSALEAAASRCPLFLSDLPWAREAFGSSASYCPIFVGSALVSKLKVFYRDAPQMAVPCRPVSWGGVAVLLRNLYEEILGEGNTPSKRLLRT